METIHAERLMKLARFLHNKLPEKKFAFGFILRGNDIPEAIFNCRAVGCAIGWLPIAFPMDFVYEQLGKATPNVVDRRNRYLWVDAYHADDSLLEFFGLTTKEAIGLFVPNRQETLLMDNLGTDASPKEVAMMIAAFVKKRSHETDTKLAGLLY